MASRTARGRPEEGESVHAWSTGDLSPRQLPSSAPRAIGLQRGEAQSVVLFVGRKGDIGVLTDAGEVELSRPGCP
jgi:hypothetical protein